MQPDGLVMVHISNRFIDLEPVLRGLTMGGQWHALLRYDLPNSGGQGGSRGPGRCGSRCRAVRRRSTRLRATTLDVPRRRGIWHELDPHHPAQHWTDDYASVLPLILWHRLAE